MNKKITKYVSMAAAFTMLSATVSCEDTEKVKESSMESIVTENTAAKESYKTSPLTLPDDISYIMQLCGDGTNMYIAAADSENKRCIYRTDSEFSVYLPYSVSDYSPYDGLWLYPMTDGRLAVLSALRIYEGLPEPDYSDPDTDWEMYNEACRHEYTIDIYNTSGTVENSVKVSGLDEKFTSYDSAALYFEAVGEGYTLILTSTSGSIAVKLDGNGAVTTKNELDADISQCGKDSEGNILCSATSEANKGSLVTVNPETLEVSASSEINKSYLSFITSGKGEYTAYMSDMDGIYGYSKGSLKLLLSWRDTGILNPSLFTAVSDTKFITVDMGTDSNREVSLVASEVRSEEELGELEIITLANCASLEIEEDVKEFNSKYDGRYMVKFAENYVEKYGTVSENGKDGLGEALNLALLAGDAPDVIVCHEFPVLQNLAAKGALADLYPFIDNDPDISREDFLPNFLSLNEYNGKLSIMPYSFTAMTLAVKEKFACGAGDNWTAEEMIAAIEAMPEGMSITSSSTPDTLLNDLLFQTTGGFINYEKRTCSFDSPGFVALLKAIKNGPFAEQINDAELTYEELEAAFDKRENAFYEDRQLIQHGAGTIEDYTEMKNKCGDDKMILAGYPSEDGSGAGMRFGEAFGIFESSEHKEAAWTFVREYLSDSVQEELMNSEGIGLGTDNSVLEKYNPQTDPYYAEYIRNIDRVFAYDYDIYNIIEEETAYYFAGERSAEDTAGLIQNRVSILISEQSW